MKYRGYHIHPHDNAILSGHPYAFYHDDYDGAPDGNDNRHGYADSVQEAMSEIDEQLFEGAAEDFADILAEEICDTCLRGGHEHIETWIDHASVYNIILDPMKRLMKA